jgi:RNA polymerase sigma-70 factor (ECF subfamily)
MLNKQEEAEDLLQESFAYAFHKINTFRNEATFGAWLKRIVVNHCINHLKKKRIELTLNDDFTQYDTSEDEYEQSSEYNVERIHQAIKLLPDGYRVIFSLYMLEGYDHNEIAEVLEITASTSKSQFHRAKKKLQEILKTI